MDLVINLSFSKLKPSNQSILFTFLRYVFSTTYTLWFTRVIVFTTVQSNLDSLDINYPAFFSGLNLVMNIYQSQSRSMAMSFLKLQHWKVLSNARVFYSLRAKAALTCVVKNNQSNEFWLAQSCIVTKWNFTLHGLVAVVRKQRSLQNKYLVMMAMSLKRKQSVLAIKDKKEVADDIVFQMTFESVVPQLNVSFFM